MLPAIDRQCTALCLVLAAWWQPSRHLVCRPLTLFPCAPQSLTPRQIGLLAQKSLGQDVEDSGISGSGAVTATSTISEIPDSYLAKRIGHLNITSGVKVDIEGAGGTMKMKRSASSN
jgi:hypothetical protein